MHIAIDIKNETIAKKILKYLSSFKSEDIEVITEDKKADNQLSFMEFAGMWKDREITVDSLREAAWKR